MDKQSTLIGRRRWNKERDGGQEVRTLVKFLVVTGTVVKGVLSSISPTEDYGIHPVKRSKSPHDVRSVMVPVRREGFDHDTKQ